MARCRFPLAARFWLVLAVLVAAMAGMGAVAMIGLVDLRDGTGSLHGSLVSTAEKGGGRFHLGDLSTSVQLYAVTRDEARRRALRGRIEEDILRADEYADVTLSEREDASLE